MGRKRMVSPEISDILNENEDLRKENRDLKNKLRRASSPEKITNFKDIDVYKKCPLCYSNSLKVTTIKLRNNSTVEVVKCENCGHRPKGKV